MRFNNGDFGPLDAPLGLGGTFTERSLGLFFEPTGLPLFLTVILCSGGGWSRIGSSWR